MNNYKPFFRVAAILWIIWGIVHMFAGVMTDYFVLAGDISAAVSGIADDIDPSVLEMDYPAASGAIIGQHGFNLFWIGLTTLIASFYIWNGNKHAIFLAAIVGGLADLGYFLFLDLGGYVKFFPGTVMTLVSSSAIILSFIAHFKTKNSTNP